MNNMGFIGITEDIITCQNHMRIYVTIREGCAGRESQPYILQLPFIEYFLV